jgi:hypothetical protein
MIPLTQSIVPYYTLNLTRRNHDTFGACGEKNMKKIKVITEMSIIILWYSGL